MKFQVGDEVYVDYDNWSWRGEVIEILPDGVPANPYPCYRVRITDEGTGKQHEWLAYDTNTYSAAEVDAREAFGLGDVEES